MKPNEGGSHMNRGDRRDINRRKAQHKKYISDHFWVCANNHPYYDNLHQYSKNKVHCSCPMCSPKSKNKGKRRQNRKNYQPSYNWKHSDLKRLLALEDQIEDNF
jgi:hypothetical protein